MSKYGLYMYRYDTMDTYHATWTKRILTKRYAYKQRDAKRKRERAREKYVKKLGRNTTFDGRTRVRILIYVYSLFFCLKKCARTLMFFRMMFNLFPQMYDCVFATL